MLAPIPVGPETRRVYTFLLFITRDDALLYVSSSRLVGRAMSRCQTLQVSLISICLFPRYGIEIVDFLFETVNVGFCGERVCG